MARAAALLSRRAVIHMGALRRLNPRFGRLLRVSRRVRYLGALLAVLVSAGMQAAVLREPSIAPFVLFFLAVAVVSSVAGRIPGLVSVAFSAAVANYAFIEPFGAWSLTRPATAATALFLVSGTATALVCGSLREALHALRESQLDLNHAQAVAHTGSWRLDIRSDALLWSDETYDMFGVPKGTPLTYETFLGIVHPDDRHLVDSSWQAALRGQPYDVEHRIVVAGLVKWVRERAHLEIDRDGTLQGGFGTVQDVTEQKQAQEALRRSEERSRTMFESAGAAIAQLDLQTGRLVKVNRRYAQLTGYSEPELEGMDYLRLLGPDEQKAAATALARGAAGEIRDGTFAERRYVRKDGQPIDVEVYAGAVQDVAGQSTDAMVVVIDVTERNAAARELAAAKLVAERAQATAEEASRAKDHFLAVLSHELRTPLSPVLTGISLLEQEPLSDRGRHFVQVIRRNVELESRLIDDLLDLTRITRGKVELQRHRVELCTIVDRAVEVCRPDIEARQLQLRIDYGPRPYPLDADAARLQQVFWNLLKNAIKFTPHGGRVGVSCRPEGDHVVVEVSDSGVGIEPSALQHIFDAFAQTQRSIARQFGGLGLGLTISKNLAEMHGGRIEASSDGPGKGSTFRVRLPIASTESPEQRGAVCTASRPDSARRRLRVLLVEDHGDTAETMVSMLAMAGHQVSTAGDAATALQAIDQDRFDVLVSDLGLPDRSGLELMRELRARGHSLPAIALSGYGQESDKEESRAAGFCAHLVKPADPHRLLETIERFARGASP